MLDIRRIRTDLDGVKAAFARRGGGTSDIDEVVALDTRNRQLTTQRDGLQLLGVGGDRIYVDHGLTARTGTGRVFGWRSPRVERATPSCDETGPAHPLAARCP